MGKGVIIHLDDREGRLAESKNYFEQCGLETDFELILFQKREDFKKAIKDNSRNLKCLIFDLWGEIPATEESGEGNAKFLEDIKRSYADYNIPIFIYTGHLDKVPPDLQHCGTVFAVDKEEGINVIYDKIKLFHESGFLEVFCPGGILEKQLHKDLHRSFTEQFRPGEIVGILETIKDGRDEGFKERATKVLLRIAVQSLMSELTSPITTGDTVNAAEHYYRRISGIEFWTGDILEKNEESKYVFILTPRCNCDTAEILLVCDIDEDFPKNQKEITNALIDNVLGKAIRYIPPSPIFKGGKIKFTSHRTIDKGSLRTNYKYLISLSVDLTNEILAKFGAFFLRTGIKTIDSKEVMKYLENLSETADE